MRSGRFARRRPSIVDGDRTLRLSPPRGRRADASITLAVAPTALLRRRRRAVGLRTRPRRTRRGDSPRRSTASRRTATAASATYGALAELARACAHARRIGARDQPGPRDVLGRPASLQSVRTVEPPARERAARRSARRARRRGVRRRARGSRRRERARRARRASRSSTGPRRRRCGSRCCARCSIDCRRATTTRHVACATSSPRFATSTGEVLESHARFEALHAMLAADDPAMLGGWRSWPAEYRDPRRRRGAGAFADEHADDIAFHAFLQWQAARQLDAAQRAAREAGMAIGIVADLAVGADGGGSQAWSRPARHADRPVDRRAARPAQRARPVVGTRRVLAARDAHAAASARGSTCCARRSRTRAASASITCSA